MKIYKWILIIFLVVYGFSLQFGIIKPVDPFNNIGNLYIIIAFVLSLIKVK